MKKLLFLLGLSSMAFASQGEARETFDYIEMGTFAQSFEGNGITAAEKLTNLTPVLVVLSSGSLPRFPSSVIFCIVLSPYSFALFISRILSRHLLYLLAGRSDSLVILNPVSKLSRTSSNPSSSLLIT